MSHSRYLNQYQAFLSDKNSFFVGVKAADSKDDYVLQRAREHDYGFIATNRLLIEQEFRQLFAVLQQRAGTSEEFYFYCGYCCIMLKHCYEIYGQPEEALQYEQLFNTLKALQKDRMTPAKMAVRQSYFAHLKEKIAEGMADLIDSPKKLSKLRAKLGAANLNRIYWFFCRTTVKNSLLLARDLKWLEKLGNILSKEIDIDSSIAILEKPNNILRFLSVGFFAVRFIMNAAMLFKHTCCPNESEEKLSIGKRFTNEIYKRHATFLNDLVWGTVNCITNYNEFFGISAPVAGWIVAGFLLFDLSLLLWRHHLAEREYLTKRSQYMKELAELAGAEGDERHRILNEQIKQLDLNWQKEGSTLLFDAAAAFLLMAGFSVSMLLTTPVLILGCYAVCTLGAAMYLSEGAYKEYKEKSLLLKHAELSGENEEKALEQYNAARNEFAFTLAKNVIVPALLIGTLAVCWQAALALATVYVACELYRSYSKHQQTQAESTNPRLGFA
ncbi:hypothetical protein [Legionella jordanis]|uniref:Coiled-coil protein n=1 Tax=Legionella jordanis TaxID=456 RepID=A0A0W0VCS0_9GAMM|nr:hypothetical protein [Legionella jordanis]KTD17880.1 coiled-coil protein [Legionella jordanis]RMX02420.1 hypothetical protein EAW55_09225 [Legionella jordanis]RMX21737.1 hypothetical protein EAS68_02995 [Legionella jordanis]VEH14029.1 coiled-coil protein [Legionella jordanis]HAT8713851.1 hypothetical protein [Legionella jordanis]